MNSKFYPFFLLIIILLVNSCKTAEKSFQKGDYEETVLLVAKKLQNEQVDARSKSLIKEAYRFAVNEHESKIKNLSASSNEIKWERIYSEYATLQKLYDAIRKSPEAFAIVKPIDYSAYLNTYADKAAENYVERGDYNMQKNDKQSYRQAYYSFQSALRYKPDDLIINEKKQKAYEAAVVNVVLMPIDRFGYRNSFSSPSQYGFENEMLRTLRYSINNSFIKFHSELDLRSRRIEPDNVIEMNFGNMNIGQIYDTRSTRQVSKDVVTREIVYKPDSIIKQTTRVSATITTTRRTLNSEGFMHIRISDEDGRNIWSDYIQGDHQWYTMFSTYSGDIRALSEDDKRMLNQREEMPPFSDEIVRVINNEIINRMAYRLRDFYSRYQ